MKRTNALLLSSKRFAFGRRLAVVALIVMAAAVAWTQDSSGIRFEKRKIKVANKIVIAEIADNSAKREHGLMFREKLADNNGMLFIFDSENQLNFWMKNTLIPLSIGFFDANKKLINIREMVPAVMGEQDPEHYSSAGSAMYALEMPKGWYARYKISRGAILDPGPLSKRHDQGPAR